MGKESNNVIRTKDVAIDNSEVELYLDTDVLAKEIEHFNWLNFRLGQWAVQMGLDNATIQNNTSGQTSASLFKFTNDFFVGDFERLRENTVKNIEIMRDAALVEANKLRAQCEHFYEIVIGNGGNTTYPTLTPILYLDTKYYDAGVMDTNTTDAATRLKNIDDEDNDLYGILLSFHYKEHLEDCSAEIESIQSDCKNRTRLQVLERAFDNYVRDVKKFNEDIEEKFNEVLDPRMALDHKRTYKYPRIQDAEERARMDRIIRNELHEMGFTDKAIDNAIGKSSITLNELAAYAEKIVMEDGAQNNDGEEIKLVVSVLEGDATAAYNKYGKKLADKAEAGWECIATYQMGLLHTSCFDDTHMFKVNEGDEAFNNYLNEMNATLQSDNAFYVMKALKGGAYNALRECGKHYLENTTTVNAFKNAQYRERYRKNFLLYDSYNFIYQKMSYESHMKRPPIIEDGVRVGEYKLYNIESVRYDNAGIHFTIMESDYTNITAESVANGSVECKANQFEMNIQTHIGTEGVNLALSEAQDKKQLMDAYNKQKEMLKQLEKDGVLVVSAATGGPLVAEGVAVGLNVFDGDTDLDDIKDVVKPGARELAGTLTESAGGQNAVYRGTGLLVDAYDYMSSTSVQAARDNEQANDYARIAGSVGYCTIVDGGETTEKFVDNHAGLYTPGHEKAFIAVSKDGVGLKDVCGWDEKTVKAVEAQLGISAKESDAVAKKYDGTNIIRSGAAVEERDGQNEDINKLKLIIEGGYEINGDTNFTDLNDSLEKIDRAYQATASGEKTGDGVYDAWDREIEDLTDEPEKITK